MDDLEGKLLTNLLVALLIGWLLDGLAGVITYGVAGAAIGALLAGVSAGAGGGAGAGAAAASLGGFWGWLAAQVADHLTEETIKEALGTTVLTWLLAGVCGWLAGQLITAVYPMGRWGVAGRVLSVAAILGLSAILWDLAHRVQLRVDQTREIASGDVTGLRVAGSLVAVGCVLFMVANVLRVSTGYFVRSLFHDLLDRDPVKPKTAEEEAGAIAWIYRHRWLVYLTVLGCLAAGPWWTQVGSGIAVLWFLSVGLAWGTAYLGGLLDGLALALTALRRLMVRLARPVLATVGVRLEPWPEYQEPQIAKPEATFTAKEIRQLDELHRALEGVARYYNVDIPSARPHIREGLEGWAPTLVPLQPVISRGLIADVFTAISSTYNEDASQPRDMEDVGKLARRIRLRRPPDLQHWSRSV